MDDSPHARAFEQRYAFTAPATPAAPARDIEAWANGARFALDVLARAAFDPLKVALEACVAEEARCVAAQQSESRAERETLPDTVRAAIRAIDWQLDSIVARVPGKRIDKRLSHLRSLTSRRAWNRRSRRRQAKEVHDDH